MKSFPRRSEKGWTLVELMMTVGIMGLIVPSLTILFTICYQGLSTSEMHIQMKALNEKIHLHLHEQINSSKHMFQNDTTISGGLNFISRLDMTSAPASVSFTKMAVQQSGVTSTFSPAAGAVTSNFGDCLFYAAADRSLTISGVAYVAPLTISGASVKDSHNNPCTINLDVYRFYYDYLSTTGDQKPIRGVQNYWLIEWQSVQFVDAFELEDIGTADSTLQSNVIKALNSGIAATNNRPITYAWDSSQIAMTSGTNFAFYTLTSAGGMTGQAALTIPMQSYTPLTRISSGQVSNFNYGIPGNYLQLSSSPPVPQIPKYCYAVTAGAPVSNVFPGGFEVGIEGSNGGMQVLVRSVLIARGNNKNGYIWDDNTSVSNARDIW